ncbi:hypothetical protein EG327_004744 [Venturia inaequalis]|uniref:Secreted protein n=1 Tax=Venturia inaequalis TaxID=5025 RepID=A0A8H3ZBJ9_VENIN|nr:hypothetical protein EG327_004744 [Venturia inaequalis]
MLTIFLNVELVVLVAVLVDIVEFELPRTPSLASSPSSSAPASPPSFGGLVVDPVPVRPDEPVPELPDRDPDDDEELLELELEPEDERPPDEPAEDEDEELPPPPARGSRMASEFVSGLGCGRARRVVDKIERARRVAGSLMIGTACRNEMNDCSLELEIFDFVEYI